MRRLIIIAARHLKPVPIKLRGPNSTHTFSAFAQNPVPLAPTFNLFDPMKSFHFREDETEFSSGHSGQTEIDTTPVNAESLHNRLRALRHALADLPKQARRLARFNARRDALLKAGRPVRISIARPGLPPGWHERGKHDVDTVLRECHRLVQYLDDTS